eukprot:Pgem_evm1s1868
MLKSLCLFKSTLCPFYRHGLCDRPFCQFAHDDEKVQEENRLEENKFKRQLSTEEMVKKDYNAKKKKIENLKDFQEQSVVKTSNTEIICIDDDDDDDNANEKKRKIKRNEASIVNSKC